MRIWKWTVLKMNNLRIFHMENCDFFLLLVDFCVLLVALDVCGVLPVAVDHERALNLGSVLGDGGDVVARPGPAITQIPQSQALEHDLPGLSLAEETSLLLHGRPH